MIRTCDRVVNSHLPYHLATREWNVCLIYLARVVRIERTLAVLEAAVLPLNDTRIYPNTWDNRL